MSTFNTYDVDAYLSIGYSIEEATKKVQENREATAKGIKISIAKSRIKRYGLTNITPEELIQTEDSLKQRIPFPNNGILKIIKAVSDNREIDSKEAFSVYETLYKKFLESGVHNPNANTEFIKELYGADSIQYKNKLESNKKSATCSFEKFSRTYADKDEAYRDFCIKYGSNNIEHLKRKHNIDEETAKEIVRSKINKGKQTFLSKPEDVRKEIGKSKSLGLHSYIKKFGQEEGTKKWLAICDLRKGQCSLDYYIEKYGEEEGNKRYEVKLDRRNMPTCIEYWTHRGYNDELAKSKLTEYIKNRPNFSREYCIQKYGMEEGIKIHKARTDLWQSTLKAKTPEEIAAINAKKGSCLEVYVNKYGEEIGKQKYEQWLVNVTNRLTSRTGKSSREATIFFLRLYKRLKKLGIISSRNDVRFSSTEDDEYYILTKNGIRYYDFLIKNINFIIEYNGVTWHPREGDYDWKSPFGRTYEEALENDKLKLEEANALGFHVEYVWSDSDIESELNRLCLKILDHTNNLV